MVEQVILLVLRRPGNHLQLILTAAQFLVITLGDTKQSTPTINKTLNPEWLVSFDLPITSPRCLLLEAVCWDKDRFGKDYLGEFDIVVDDLFINGQISQEVKYNAVHL